MEACVFVRHAGTAARPTVRVETTEQAARMESAASRTRQLDGRRKGGQGGEGDVHVDPIPGVLPHSNRDCPTPSSRSASHGRRCDEGASERADERRVRCGAA